MKNKQSFFKRFLVAFIGLFSVVSTSSLVACSASTHTVTLINENEEGGSIYGGGTYKTGSQVTLTYKANNEYEFAGWTINGETIKTSGRSYQFKMPNNDVTVTGNFEYKSFYVETVLYGFTDKATISKGGTYRYGDTVTISLTNIDSGYEAKYWRINDGEEINKRCNTLTFTMPLSRVRVSCEIYYKSIDVHFTSNRSDNDGHDGMGEQTLLASSTMQYLHINDGIKNTYIDPITSVRYATKKYEITTASGNLIASDEFQSPVSDVGLFLSTTDEDLYVNVTFADSALVDIHVVNGGYINSVSGNWNRYDFFIGEMIVMQANPNTGWKFEGWYENDVLISQGGGGLAYTITKDATLEARFSII